jgi:hypothetical protein
MTWESKFHDGIPDKLPSLFSEGARITKVCVKLGINRDTYYEWKKTYPEFARAAKQGELTSQMWWEDKGKEGIFGDIEKFAGSSWQFVMKNRFREDYKDDSKEEKSTDTSVLEKILNGEITINK